MSRRLLTQITLLVGALTLSVGLQSLAAFTEPNTAPPNADAYAPLTTGPAAQAKAGGLVLGGGLTIGGNTGIGTTKPKGTLDVENGKNTASLCLNGSCTKNLSNGSGIKSVYLASHYVGNCPWCNSGARYLSCPAGYKDTDHAVTGVAPGGPCGVCTLTTVCTK